MVRTLILAAALVATATAAYAAPTIPVELRGNWCATVGDDDGDTIRLSRDLSECKAGDYSYTIISASAIRYSKASDRAVCTVTKISALKRWSLKQPTYELSFNCWSSDEPRRSRYWHERLELSVDQAGLLNLKIVHNTYRGDAA
jgi:hypothetical protein